MFSLGASETFVTFAALLSLRSRSTSCSWLPRCARESLEACLSLAAGWALGSLDTRGSITTRGPLFSLLSRRPRQAGDSRGTRGPFWTWGASFTFNPEQLWVLSEVVDALTQLLLAGVDPAELGLQGWQPLCSWHQGCFGVCPLQQEVRLVLGS